jgi:hypothetical protein
MQNKPALEWFKQLPEPYRTQAIENSTRPDAVYQSLSRALISDFTWESTPQGGIHWHDIYERAELGEFDTPQAEVRQKEHWGHNGNFHEDKS